MAPGQEEQRTSRAGNASPPPLVSIGMAVYNGEQYIREAVDSALNQTLADFELIISDNASTDRTAEICKEYVERDSRVRYVRNERNIGGAANFNATFKLARGRYFKWLACDDKILPTFLERCVAALEANPRASLAYSQAAMIDDASNVLHRYEGAFAPGAGWSRSITQRYKRFMREVTRNYSMTVPVYVFGVVPSKVLAKTHLQRFYLSQDDNLVAELILGGEVIEVPETLNLIRYHAGSSGWIEVWNAKHIQNWYRPGEKSSLRRIFRLGWRHRLEYFRLVLAADATPFEKVLLTYENLRAIGQRGRHKLELMLQKHRKVEQILPWRRY